MRDSTVKTVSSASNWLNRRTSGQRIALVYVLLPAVLLTASLKWPVILVALFGVVGLMMLVGARDKLGFEWTVISVCAVVAGLSLFFPLVAVLGRLVGLALLIYMSIHAVKEWNVPLET